MNNSLRIFIYTSVLSVILVYSKDNNSSKAYLNENKAMISESSLTNPQSKWVIKSVKINSERRLQLSVSDDREL